MGEGGLVVGGGSGRGEGGLAGGRGAGTFQSSCHILHYHMVLRPKGTSHNRPGSHQVRHALDSTQSMAGLSQPLLTDLVH